MSANDGDNRGVRPACCAGGRASRARGAGAREAPGVFAPVQAEDSRRIRTPRPSWSKRPASARRVVHVVDLGLAQAAEEGALQALGGTRGRPPADQREHELARLRQENARLQSDLAKAKRVIDVQRKLS